jgi:peptidoglycan/LPS O-acetylase OafA/YrhL
MNRVLAWFLPLAIGAAFAAASCAFGSTDPGLTAAVGASSAVAVGLAVRHPDVVYEEGTTLREVGRWSAASTAFVLAAAVFGVGWTLPVGPDLQLSLRLLVLGVGYAMWVFGVAYARAKARSRASATDTRTESGGQSL